VTPEGVENIQLEVTIPTKGRPLHRPAGQAAVVVHVAKRDPAGMTLAHDVGLARFPLGVERIEFLLEALVGRFSGVNRATDGGPVRARSAFAIDDAHATLDRLSVIVDDLDAAKVKARLRTY
jgi:hypothetical protein